MSADKLNPGVFKQYVKGSTTLPFGDVDAMADAAEREAHSAAYMASFDTGYITGHVIETQDPAVELCVLALICCPHNAYEVLKLTRENIKQIPSLTEFVRAWMIRTAAGIRIECCDTKRGETITLTNAG